MRFFSVVSAGLLSIVMCGCNPPNATHTRHAAVTTKANAVTAFSDCRHFFPGELPRVPDLEVRRARDLCYDAFAILHSTVLRAVKPITQS
jgi:endonuclease G